MEGNGGERSSAELVFWVHEPECATELVQDKCRLADRQPAGRAARARRSCEARCCQRHGLSKFVIEPCKGERCSTHGAAMEGKGLSLTDVRAWQCLPTRLMVRQSHERNEQAANSSDSEQAHRGLNVRHEPRNCAHSWLRRLDKMAS